ncbi:MAG: radical SAM protein [Desulfobacterales bacterium]|nr:radical SAM protein [Desulfobacterales bacterium]
MKQTVAFSKNAVNVFFHILTGCNLHCRHCYINPEQHGTQTLPIDLIEKWLGLFAARAKEANVIFLGGEPTLHPELSQAVRAARRLGYRSITVDTNGYLFNDFLDRVSPEEIDAVSFSLDGPTAAINDTIRGEGCFDRCVSGIRQAVARGFSTSLIYTVSRENLHALKEMPALLDELGVERFFIQVIGIRGKSASGEFVGSQLSREEWTRVVPAVAKKAAESGRVVSYPKVFLEPGEVFECAGNVAENYFIFPNGRVYRCPLCEDFPIHGMQIHEGHLVRRSKINEEDLFSLQIPEGCVMNKLVQPDNLEYDKEGRPLYRIACCLLKEELRP